MPYDVKLKIQNAEKLPEDIRKLFQKVLENKQMMREIGDSILSDIRETTQVKEKSIPLGMSDLKLLKEKWIFRRRRLAQFNDTDPAYGEGRSNLTLTGQLLKSMEHKIIGLGRMLFFFKGDHKGYISPTGIIGKDMSNEKLAKYVAEGGRPFFGTRPAMRLRVNRIVKRYMKRALLVQKYFKTVDK